MVEIIKGVTIVMLGLFAGSIAFLVHYIFTVIPDNPAIQIQIAPQTPGRYNTIIQIANDGKVPVTNLNLTIKTPNAINIKDSSNLTTVHAIWNKINATVSEAHVHKLIHGTGSIIYISIPSRNNQSFDCKDYSAYAVYDQGSVRGHCAEFFDVVYQFNILHNSVKIGILVALVIFILAGLLMFIQRYFEYLRLSKRKRLKLS